MMKNRVILLSLLLIGRLCNLAAVSVGKADSLVAGIQSKNPAAAPVRSFQGGGDWFYLLFKLVILLVILSGVIYLLVWFLKKLQFRRGFGGTLPPELYKVIGLAPLSYNKQFMLIKFYDKVYLLAAGEHSIACLDRIEDPEKIADIESLVPVMDNLPDRFAKVLKKKIRQAEKGGQL